MREIEIIGAGPAGSAAALAVAKLGGAVRVREKSRFPRHKVCGEFLSPEIAPLLESLGVWGDFEAARPARIRRLVLRFASREKRCALPDAAYGLSRYCFDSLLARGVVDRGDKAVCGADALVCARPPGRALEAEWKTSTSRPGGRLQTGGSAPLEPDELHSRSAKNTIIAHGRRASAPRGRRLFGFKAHFEGPCEDAVELYFFNRCYVGINTVENGITNVCGLGPEHLLRVRNFEIDQLLSECPALRQRLGPLRRKMDWLMTGPLVFETHFDARQDVYMAGDALSFVDPFTGSGILSAVLTGSLAGEAAMRETPVEDYLRQCRERLHRPFLISSIFRSAVASGWGEYLAPFIPGSWLVRLTRPA